MYIWRGNAAQAKGFNTFCRPKLPESKKKPVFLRDGETERNQILGGHRNVIVAPEFFSDISLSFDNRSLKIHIWAKFRTF